MDALYLVGRILFGLIFLFSGFGHFAQANATAGYAAAKGVPAPMIGTLASGAMILAGGLSVILGVWMEIGTWLLILFLLAAAFWTSRPRRDRSCGCPIPTRACWRRAA